MAKNQVGLKTAGFVLDELDRLHEAISLRAYEHFRNGGGHVAGPLDDWLRAERELVWRPAVEVRQADGQIEVLAAVPGLEPKDLNVEVAPEDVLITRATERRHESTEGAVHVTEFNRGTLVRLVHLPDRIDPRSAKAECRNGLLRLTAAVVKASPESVDAQAA